jgi:hypothetical protein
MMILRIAACWLALVFSHTAFAAGTWAPLTNKAPGKVSVMLLLMDGTVMAHEATIGNTWYRLTPDSHGSYANGTWTTLASMNDTRFDFASQVLIDGRVFVAGGEYGIGLKTAEVYNPLTNTWTETPPTGQTAILDAESKLLPNGNVLIAPVVPTPTTYTALYNPTANTWSVGPELFRGSNQDETSWVQLPDNSIISIDPFGTNSERYIPATNTWINDSTMPVDLWSTFSEMGAGFLLPNGQAVFLGANGLTAYYTPTGNINPGTWTAGPSFPSGYQLNDVPACMMPNGKILCATGDPYGIPTYFFEFDYVANTITAVPGPGGSTDNANPNSTNMLMAPDGTVLYSDSTTQVYAYVPDGTPLASGAPTITSIAQNADASFLLTGTLLNGISQGAAYGDDGQMDSGYPIVRLTGSGGTVYTARSFGRSSTSLQGSTPMTTEFFLPAGIPAGTYSVTVTANGITSAGYSLAVAPIVISLPAGAAEGAGVITGTVTLPSAPISDTVVSLASSQSGAANVPASVTVAAHATSATFPLFVGTTPFLGAQAASISATASGYQGGAMRFVVQGSETAVLAISPTTNYNPSGPAGGPLSSFTPSSATYTLTNNGNIPLTWSVSHSNSFFSLSSFSGTLAAGAHTTVTATLNSNVSKDAVGTYTDTILFDNTTNGDGDTSVGSTLTVSTSTDATLSNLVMGKGSLTPAFTSGNTSYTDSVTYTASTIKVTPTVNDTTSTVTVNGVMVTSGSASGAINLAVGANTISIVVTAQSGATMTYTVVVTRGPPATNANLSDLVLSAGTLTPVFASGTTGYAANVSDTTASVTVTPITSGSDATVTVNNAPVVSGTMSAPITLSTGANTINTVVTAEDGVTTESYTVVVTQLTHLQTWRLNYFGITDGSGNTADTADYDGNGIPNLAKYAFGLDPTSPAANAIPQPILSGGNYSITFTEPSGMTGITYGAQWTPTLNPPNWQPVTDTGSGTTHVFSISLGVNPNAFLRLTVTDNH